MSRPVADVPGRPRRSPVARGGAGAALDSVARRLTAAGVPTPAVDAALLVAHVLGVSPAEVRARAARSGRASGLPAGAHRRLERLVGDRERRVPLQHLVREAAFRELVVRCRPGVFVPRPETELVAGAAITRLRAHPAEAGGRQRVVVEPGTGTGVIALSIAVEVPAVEVVATDVDPRAVRLARRNLARVAHGRPGVADGSACTIVHGDLLAPVDDRLRGHVDVLVSNPPYLAAEELERCQPEVRDHDPVGALVAGADGHEIVDRLIAQASTWLAPGGWLVLEISEHRAGAAARRASAAGLVDVDVEDDLTGRSRVLVGRRAA